MFGLRLIIILVVVSSIIAFLGDRIGHYIGRKRLTLFNIRPHRTAIIITILSGILIATLTTVILITVSEDARTALFGLEELKSSVAQKSKELQALYKDIKALKQTKKDLSQKITSLQKEEKRLRQTVEIAHRGSILFRIDEPIVVTTIDGGKSKKDIEEKLKDLLSTANSLTRKYSEKKEDLITLPEEEFKQAIGYIQNRSGNLVVRLVAARNIVFGEKIPTHLEIFENILVFEAREEITSGIVDGRKDLSEIETRLKEFLSYVNFVAKQKGVLPDPRGHVGNISYAKIFQIAKEIKTINKLTYIKVSTLKDTYTIGPLEIDMKIIKS